MKEGERKVGSKDSENRMKKYKSMMGGWKKRREDIKEGRKKKEKRLTTGKNGEVGRNVGRNDKWKKKDRRKEK